MHLVLVMIITSFLMMSLPLPRVTSLSLPRLTSLLLLKWELAVVWGLWMHICKYMLITCCKCEVYRMGKCFKYNYRMLQFSLVVRRENIWNKLGISGSRKVSAMQTGLMRPPRLTAKTLRTLACHQQMFKVSVLWIKIF